MMEILYRLIRDGKVVGEERHHKCIETGCIHIQHRTKKDDWADVVENPECYIPHDRKDMYTGREDKNGRKVFNRDKILIHGSNYMKYKHKFPRQAVVRWFDEGCSWEFDSAEHDNKSWRAHKATIIEVIGIEGVEE